ncbi:hypothetical protein D3C73_1560530 [compost metagenome]
MRMAGLPCQQLRDQRLGLRGIGHLPQQVDVRTLMYIGQGGQPLPGEGAEHTGRGQCLQVVE